MLQAERYVELKVVDLFCGVGGFSTGAHAAGFDVVRAIDLDPILTSSFATNFPGVGLALADIATLSASDLNMEVGVPIDGLIGGPPCQGFSLIGKRDEADPRRELVHHFFRLVASVRPRFFVMENVVGIMQGKAFEVLDSAMSRIPSCYAVLGPTVFNACDFGGATNRPRCFVIGVLNEFADLPLIEKVGSDGGATVRDAIADLAASREVGMDGHGFDVHELEHSDQISDYARALRSEDRRFTGNRRTVHSEAVAKRFEKVEQGKCDPVGRHQRLSWSGRCPTLRAGTGADRGSYQSVRPLHPDEPRVITVREAARLQGFPDAHRFHPTVWHSFRMIGNSVSPPVATAVMKAIASAFGMASHAKIAAE